MKDEKSIRMLWLEDIPGFIKYTMKRLISMGVIVDHISFVDDLEDKLQENKYDLVILDMMLPTKGVFKGRDCHSGITTGLVAFNRIVKKVAPTTPVVFITALSETLPIAKDIEGEMRKHEQVKDFIYKSHVSVTDLPERLVTYTRKGGEIR